MSDSLLVCAGCGTDHGPLTPQSDGSAICIACIMDPPDDSPPTARELEVVRRAPRREHPEPRWVLTAVWTRFGRP